MTTAVHLVRHGHHALLGKQLCGRKPGVALDELGCRQMERLAVALRPPPAVIQSSPQSRARQSATILAARFGLAVEIVPAMDEINAGDWTSLTFEKLGRDPQWRLWNERRGSYQPPNGESMQELQRRVVHHLEELRENTINETIVIVSHAEPIRAALLHYLGRSLDEFLSIRVDPASVSTLRINETGIEIARMNQQVPA